MSLPDCLRYNFLESELDKPQTECGVFGLCLHSSLANSEIAEVILDGSLQNQHRGEESVGFCISDGYSVSVPLKRMGYVKDLYREYENDYKSIRGGIYGHMGLGHNRYSTTGSSNIYNAGPHRHVDQDLGAIATALNGNITNASQLRSMLISRGSEFKGTTDSEIIGELIVCSPGPTWDEKIINASRQLEGAFNLVILTKDALYGVRDPNGFHPLSVGTFLIDDKPCFAISSETSGFSNLPVRDILDVPRGNVVKMQEGAITITRFLDEIPGETFCGLDIAYLMRPDSYLDKVQLDTIRRLHGAALAEACPLPMSVKYVTYIPESARSSAEGYAERLSQLQDRLVSVRTSMIKGRYGTINGNVRGFISPNVADRGRVANKNYFPFEWVEGEEIGLIDDSIIRGTVTCGVVHTIKERVGFLKDGGATKVHLRIVWPPVISFCPYGIDINEMDFLLAKEFEGNLEAMAGYLGADSLAYLPLKTYEDTVSKAVGHNKGLCSGCVTGEYPTKVEQANKLILEGEI